MIDASGIILGGVLPAVVAAAAMLGGWKLTRHAGVAWLLGLSMGYLAGHWALDAQGVGVLAAVAKSFNPHEARDWLPLAVVAAAAIEAIGLLGKRAATLAWVLRVAVDRRVAHVALQLAARGARAVSRQGSGGVATRIAQSSPLRPKTALRRRGRILHRTRARDQSSVAPQGCEEGASQTQSAAVSARGAGQRFSPRPRQGSRNAFCVSAL